VNQSARVSIEPSAIHDEFLTYLGPIMNEVGIELAQAPAIMPVVDLVQARSARL
jgi:hypothetical protein